MELGNFGWSSTSGGGGGGGGTGTVTLVFAATGMAFSNITNSGGIAIDTTKVPYYSAGFSQGFAKYNGSSWIFDNSTYLTTADAASTYLSQSNAALTYLTQANAASTYLTQASAASTYLNLGGGTMSGYLILNADPSNPLGAATKQYVDNIASGINFHAPTYAASTANLSANYLNGASGLGATLTATSNGALVLDGVDFSTLPVLPSNSYRVLIWQQSNQIQNGIYTVTQIGSGSLPFILTRATDADNSPSGELAYGDFSFNENGTLYGGNGFIMNASGTINIGSSNITYVQFNAAQVITAGTGLTESPTNTLNIDTAKVPYYAGGFSTGFAKWNGSSWIFDNSTYLTTSDAASTYLTIATAASTYYPSSNPSGYITSASLTGTYVPYTGANANVNLGVFSLIAQNVYGSTVASASLTLSSTTDATKGNIIMDSSILINEGYNIAVGSTTGTKIGTATTQKLGFYNATPIVQPSAVTTPQGIATALTSLGLLATSTINSVTLTTTGIGGSATYDQATNTLNIPTYVSSGGTAVGTFSNVYAFNNFK